MSSIEIRRITSHLRVFIPARIGHERHGNIIVWLRCTTTQTDRMVLHQRTWEELFEPVGVTHLGTVQIGITCFFSVDKPKLSRRRIVGVDEFIHLSINTVVTAIQHIREIEPSFVLHFLIDTHLILGIQNVELTVSGNQTWGKLTGIVHMSLSRTAFFRSNNNNATHGTCSINRRSRTVFQDLKTLNIIRIKSCNGWRNQRLCITRWQCIGTDISDIFLNNAVNHPQWFWITIDRSGTTHMDFRCRTKGSRYVLHAHSGWTTFKWTADIGHSANQSIAGLNLIGCTCEQSAVHVRDTCYHNLVQCRIVRGQNNLHIRLRIERLRLHANVTDDHFLAFWHCQRELSVWVGHCSGLRPLHDNRSTDNGFVVFRRDNRSGNLSLCRRYSHAQEEWD